ncbi:MAG: hypothetical protein LBE13_07595 [Bacteroidales bacterium]|jgi:hypothetical protein|nr:hypothetical protein [Bacteroidales bacterium]
MKQILLLSLCLLSGKIYAQEILSREAMLDDIHFLVHTIKETNPHLFIRRQITGTDIVREIDSLRQTAEKITSFEEFYYLAKRILLRCQDQHADLKDYYPQGIERTNPFITAEALERSAACSREYDFYSPDACLPVVYVNGEYFFNVTYYDEDRQTVIPAGAKFVRINNVEIDDYVAGFNRHVDNSVKWDFRHQKYYTTRIYFPFITGMVDNFTCDITYSVHDSRHTFRYQGAQIERNAPKDINEPKVLYFQKKHILYIRIPGMDMNDLDFYTQHILQHKNDSINKIIIDIRSNGGGNDRLWESILSTIRKNPFAEIQEKTYLKNTPTIKNYLSSMRDERLDEQNRLTVGCDTFVRIIDTDERPVLPSLDYTGNIYVLTDDKCFSSSLAFSATCNRMENVFTVGQPSGYIGGRGITPLFFSLPHSKLIFSISPTLDATDVKASEDYYDRQVKIPVIHSVEDLVLEIAYEGERYDEEFLFNHDSVFQKVLEQKD